MDWDEGWGGEALGKQRLCKHASGCSGMSTSLGRICTASYAGGKFPRENKKNGVNILFSTAARLDRVWNCGDCQLDSAKPSESLREFKNPNRLRFYPLPRVGRKGTEPTTSALRQVVEGPFAVVIRTQGPLIKHPANIFT